MNIRMERESSIVDKLRKILVITHPKRLKLSPRTLRMILARADRSEIDVVELDLRKTGKKNKYISFHGIPVIQYATSFHQIAEVSAS